VILLLMGAFMLSKAIEKSGVHERFALGMIRAVGGHGGAAAGARLRADRRGHLHVGVEHGHGADADAHGAGAARPQQRPRLTVPVLLAIAYGASIGGMGTLIGTPPNVIFAGIYAQETGSSSASSAG
jgi:solute carrier family 13 (sodium-dependent dicarboxylate transporter), member 2/3/5